jgi:hypothetical protein
MPTMSLEMCFWLVSDEQLSSFRRRAGAFSAFAQSAGSLRGVPLSAPLVVDHRNVALFHFLLNGTEEGAFGPSRIFETWFRPHRCADLQIDDLAFGMDSANVQELLQRLRALPETEIRARERLYGEMFARRERLWSFLVRPRTRKIDAVDDEDTYLEECFANLREVCERAVASDCGLIWAPG